MGGDPTYLVAATYFSGGTVGGDLTYLLLLGVHRVHNEFSLAVGLRVHGLAHVAGRVGVDELADPLEDLLRLVELLRVDVDGQGEGADEGRHEHAQRLRLAAAALHAREAARVDALHAVPPEELRLGAAERLAVHDGQDADEVVADDAAVHERQRRPGRVVGQPVEGAPEGRLAGRPARLGRRRRRRLEPELGAPRLRVDGGVPAQREVDRRHAARQDGRARVDVLEAAALRGGRDVAEEG